MPDSPKDNSPLSIQQAATLARVSVRTIYNRITDGTLQTTWRGATRRVTAESMASWLTYRKERKPYGSTADRPESGK